MGEKSMKKINAVDWSTLRGKFFHTFDDEGYVSHQGRIIDLIEEDIAIVGYFSWANGSPTTVHAIWVSDIVEDSWALYGTQEAMLEACDIGLVKSKPIWNIMANVRAVSTLIMPDRLSVWVKSQVANMANSLAWIGEPVDIRLRDSGQPGFLYYRSLSETSNHKPLPQPPPSNATVRYTFSDWAGSEDVMNVCQQYIVSLEGFVKDGIDRGFLTG